MSEAENKEGGAKAPAGGGGGLLPMIQLGVTVLLLVGVGVIGVKVYFGGDSGERKEAKKSEHGDEKGGEEGGEEKKGEGGEGKEGEGRPIVALDTITVRLKNPEVDRYARAAFNLELASQADVANFRSAKPMVQDAVLGLLTDRTSEDLNGSLGLQKLKADIRERIEPLVGKSHLKAVYVVEFIVN